MKQTTFWLFIIILLIGGFLRFYKLDFGEGLYTHPDEYHIVSSVSQLSFPNQMNPHFFSYGTVTIYLIYFTKMFLTYMSSITNYQLLITNAFLVGRFYSALFSTLTIIPVYNICKTFLEKKYALLAAGLVAFTPGLIQQAHFATPESVLTLLIFVSLFYLLRFNIILASIFAGLAIGVKIVAALFIPIIFAALFIRLWHLPKELTRYVLISLAVITVTFAIVSPYVFLDYKDWRSSMSYEGSVATGSILVFYTRQFINTTPIVFQFEKILPYALGPVMLLFGLFGLLVIIASSIKKPGGDLALLTLAFFLLFLPNALLFAKWTRFIAPTFPFFAIFSAFLLQKLEDKSRAISYTLTAIIFFTTVLWSLAFFSIYTRHDVRVEASNWLETNVPVKTSFLVEGGNMIDLPLKGDYRKTSLDFYNLEDDLTSRQKVVDALYSSDYFLVQSRRVFMNHQRLPDLYPKTARFYDALFAGELGFAQVKEFHSFPTLEIVPPQRDPAVGGRNWKLEISDEGAEETWSVFDHPVIRVFKKEKQLTKEEYFNDVHH